MDSRLIKWYNIEMAYIRKTILGMGKDITGQRFGRLVAVKPTEERKNRKVVWEFLCDCGNITHTTSNHVKRGITNSCGCIRKEWQNEGQKGIRNPYWKGGITPESHKARTLNEYHLWRMSVFSRDGFICQKCGEYKGKSSLQAHHIKPFSIYPELRLAIDNGITFCKECHKQFHIMFGKKDFPVDSTERFV